MFAGDPTRPGPFNTWSSPRYRGDFSRNSRKQGTVVGQIWPSVAVIDELTQ